MVASVRLVVVVVQWWWREVRARVLLIRRGEGFMIALLHCNRGLSALCHLQPGNVCACGVMERPVWQETSGDDRPAGVTVGHGRWAMGWGSRGQGMIWSSRYDVVVKLDGFHVDQTRAEWEEQKEKNKKQMKKQSNGKCESSRRNWWGLRFWRSRINKKANILWGMKRLQE